MFSHSGVSSGCFRLLNETLVKQFDHFSQEGSTFNALFCHTCETVSLFLLPLGPYSPSAAAGGESWSRWIGCGISRKKAEGGVDRHLVSLVDRVRTQAKDKEIRGRP